MLIQASGIIIILENFRNQLNKEHGPHFLLIPTLFKVENFKYSCARDYNAISLNKIKTRFMEAIENHAGTL